MIARRSWKMRVRINVALAMLAGIAFVACDDQGPFDESPQRLDGKVLFGFSELPIPYDDPEGPLVLELWLATETTYPCCNCRIIAETSLRPAGGRVELQGILDPGVCLTAIGPAGASFAWGLPNGTVPLQFVHGKVTDRYALQVSDSTIVVSPAGGLLTRPRELVFRRPAR